MLAELHPSVGGRDHARATRREDVDALMLASTRIARIAERARDAAALASFDRERERGRRVFGDGEAPASKQFRLQPEHERAAPFRLELELHGALFGVGDELQLRRVAAQL